MGIFAVMAVSMCHIVTSFRISCPGPARPGEARNRAVMIRLAVFGSALLASLVSVSAQPAQKIVQPSDLFQNTKVWTVHLKFTADNWQALEPAGGGLFSFLGGLRLLGGFGRRNAGPFGGPGGFEPGNWIAPAFLKQGDQDQDGQLSQAEFDGLAATWFTTWDKAQTGQLNRDQLQAGLAPTLTPQDAGTPGDRSGVNFLRATDGKRNGLASAMGVEFNYVHADLDFDGRRFTNVAVRYKGNGTWMQSRGSLKHSLKVDLNKFVKGQKLGGVTKLNFHNCVSDASWMNEVLSHRLFRDAGVPAPRTAYTRVFVTVPGQQDHRYLGLCSMVENIDGNFTGERSASKQGAIFKPVTPRLFDYLGDDWTRYQQTYDPKTELSEREKRRVIEFARLVTQASDADFAAQLGDYLDLDELARFLAVTVWLPTLDGLLATGQNFYMYLDPKTWKFQFIPWDLDHSFGQFFLLGTQEQRENLSIHHPWAGENRFLERLFQVSRFKALYLAKLKEFSQTIFQPERFLRQVDELAALIRPAVAEESEAKLARFDAAVSGKPGEPAGFGGFGRSGPATKPIKAYVNIRAQSVLDQLSGKSEGQTASRLGFGGRGRFGGAGGPQGFEPGRLLSGAFVTELDADKNGSVSRDEFTQGFRKWFTAWKTDPSGALTEEELRAGINKTFSTLRGGSP